MDEVAVVRSRTTINTIGDAFFVSREEEERKEEREEKERREVRVIRIEVRGTGVVMVSR